MDEAPGDFVASDALRSAQLFAGLDAAELDRIAARSTTRTYARDEVVFNAGDDAAELLVIAWGELAVSNEAGTVARLRAGDVVGELALLLDEPRSATVTCARAARVLVLDREVFRELVRDQPQMLAYLTQLLSRRAADFVRARPTRPTTSLVAVVADEGVPGASLVARAITTFAPTIGPRDALLLRVGSGTRTVAEVAQDPAGALREAGSERAPVLELAMPAGGPAAVGEAVAALVGEASARFRVIVIDVAGPVDAPTREALRQWCDSVVRVTTSATGAAQPGVLRVVNRRHPASPALPLKASEPFVLPEVPRLVGKSSADAAALLAASPRDPATRTLLRLTRALHGATVGIALGAGAALAIAHIGVIQALEAADVPIDMAVGTSFGSIIALGVGSGMSGDEMYRHAEKMGNRRTALSALQPSLTGTGLLNTKRITDVFRPIMTAHRFTELIVPAQVVTMDVSSGERIPIGEGLLEDAARASCAVPLVFAPSRLNGRTLVDGAMTDPVPADIAREMGADIVVGVNVAARPVPGSASLPSKILQRVNPLTAFAGGASPGMLDTLMTTLQVIQYELGEFRSLSADVRACVDLTGFSWIEFHRAIELVAKGRATGEAIATDVAATLAARVA